jgi:hypothetical protein
MRGEAWTGKKLVGLLVSFSISIAVLTASVIPDYQRNFYSREQAHGKDDSPLPGGLPLGGPDCVKSLQPSYF